MAFLLAFFQKKCIFLCIHPNGGHMLINNIHVKAFKSIHQIVIPLDNKVTVLIGPNESGKTNILKSIESFRPEIPFTTDLTCQYSTLYEDSKPPQIGLEFTNFTRDERAKLSKVYDGFKSIDSFILRKDGPNYSDYKIQANDKTFTIGNVKPLFKYLPKIIYFDTISIIKDRIDQDTLVKGNIDSLTERNLLKIGGIDDPSIIFEDTTRGRRAAEETGREITRRIQETWSQEPSLDIKLRVNGKLLYIDFSDSTTVYDTPKSRSVGFLWYLSFYINFIAVTKEAKANEFIFLLDEPGLHLHPSGQKDLTNLLENLSIKNQLIYTTHSPFMINRDHPERVRLVSKDHSGTQIDNEAYRENWKPLRNSIGLTVGDLLFFSSSGLLLEIPSKKSSRHGKMKKKKQPK
jgi:predicted ATP-dependent endonuclease of OLD family